MPSNHKGINVSRLKTVCARQVTPSWDNDYVPAIFATPQETLSVSRALILKPKKLNCREGHLLSTSERNAALLGLYYPDVIDLLEQRMLSPEHCPLCCRKEFS